MVPRFLVLCSLVGLLGVSLQATSQTVTKALTAAEENALRMAASPAPIADTVLWKSEGVVNLQFSQVHLKNWAAGGQSNLSLMTKYDHNWNLDRERIGWDTELHLAFGMLHRPEDHVFIKTDDRFEWSSKWGYRATETAFMTIMAQFRSQFAPGYSMMDGIPDRDNLRSNWMAPGYGVFAAGIDYKNSKGGFTLFFAPFTYKGTWVLDDSLSQAGAFGVEPGERFRYELGGYVKLGWVTQVVENVTYSLRLDLFSNFVANPENVDLFTDHVLSLKINSYLTATISATFIYDDDVILTKEPIEVEGEMIPQQGPGVQFKEVISVGLSLKF